jgi:hypothetical protein
MPMLATLMPPAALLSPIRQRHRHCRRHQRHFFSAASPPPFRFRLPLTAFITPYAIGRCQLSFSGFSCHAAAAAYL